MGFPIAPVGCARPWHQPVDRGGNAWVIDWRGVPPSPWDFPVLLLGEGRAILPHRARAASLGPVWAFVFPRHPTSLSHADSFAPYEIWLQSNFPWHARSPLATRHHRLWRWFDAFEEGKRQCTQVEVWPRGGGKSTTTELGVAYLAAKLSRRFVLYVSGTQHQADRHTQAIASMLESLGFDRMVGKYNSSRGWSASTLRTSSGFNCMALGLDTAARGIKLDEFRPDLIIFDDVDGHDDSPLAVEKKQLAITQTLIPAGSPDCSVLFIQNLVHDEGIVARLVDGRADFLLDREVAVPEPAVRGLELERSLDADGRVVYQIIGGEATWAGQDLSTCEAQINLSGPTAFLRESQHEVFGRQGMFFDVREFRSCQANEVPSLSKVCRAWDLAATQGGGDYTVGALLGLGANGVIYVLNIVRGQWSSDRVRREVLHAAQADRAAYPQVVVRLPQDPSQAGKDQALQYLRMLSGHQALIESVTGSKSMRARSWQAMVNEGNAVICTDAWNQEAIDEHKRFREDEQHGHDDIIDACSDACNYLLRSSTPAKAFAPVIRSGFDPLLNLHHDRTSY